MSKITFILMRTSNDKVGMLTEMEHIGSKVISRKSTGYKIPKKQWNQKTLSVNPRVLGSQEINEYINKRLNKPKGIIERKEEHCAIQYMRRELEKQKKMGSMIESTYIKYDTVVKNFEYISENIMGGRITFDDLRELSTIEKIITSLKFNKNPKKKLASKKNKTIYNYMSIFATYVKKWNMRSGTHYPINTQTFFYEIGKSNAKLATSLTEEDFIKLKNYIPRGRSSYQAQIKAKSIFLFQYYCAGIRIIDAMLLTNKQITDTLIQINIKKTGQISEFPFNYGMAKSISPFYIEDFNQIVHSTLLSDINLTVESIRDLMTLDIDDFKNINLENITLIKEQLEQQQGKSTDLISSIVDIKFELEYEIAKRFFRVIKSKPIHFIFPYLKWIDFSEVHDDTRMFNKTHCKLISQAQNKHNRNLNTISEFLGLPRLGGHTPRHTISNHLYKWGYSIVQIQSILVHSNPLTTAKYLKERHSNKLASDTLLSAHKKMREVRISY